VTSHGGKPISAYAEAASDAEKRQIFQLKRDYPALDRFQIATDAVATGTAKFSNQLDAIDAGASADDVFMTPSSLASALNALPETTQRTLVLQGCYSGGFIDSGKKEEDLRSIGNVTVLTAASKERPSFGCGMGDKRTYFGGAVLSALEKTEELLPHVLNWEEIYRAAAATVSEMESKEGFKPSEPQFYRAK
jgi:hypothetical protein